MSSINCPPPTYQAATQGLPAYEPLETPPSGQYTQAEHNDNTVYSVPIYPQQQQQQPLPCSQHYYPPVIAHAEAEHEIYQQRIKRRNCICLTLTFVFWIIVILKFVLFGMIRSSQRFNN